MAPIGSRSTEDLGPAPHLRYRLLAPLGEGGMGVVWKAEDTKLGRIVALKKIKGDPGDRGVGLQRFVREAQLAARLNHPGIVGVFDCGEMDGACFITMEYIEGRTFSELLKDTRAAKEAGKPEGMARLRDEIRHLAEVAEAVGHAHRQGIIHRDLKPGNIILDANDRPRVMDFGLAKEVSLEEGKGFRDVQGALTVQGAVVGTPAYMSPEQADARVADVGPVTDVWALGVILYEILTGRRPFGGATLIDTLASVMADDPIPPRSRFSQVPVELEAVCLRALEKRIHRRYPNAGSLAEELRAWLAGEPVAARPLAGTARLWRTARRNRTALSILTAVLAVMIALSWGWVARRAATHRMRQVQDEMGATVQELQTTLMTIEMPIAARGALARQPLKVLHALLAADPDFGPAYSWRGRVFSLIGRNEEAEADFDRGCSLSPASAIVWYLRGMHAIQKYADSRGLPSAVFEPGGVRFQPMPPESEQEASWKRRGLADLERMAAATANDDSLGAPELALGRAMAALHGGGPDAYESALAHVAELDRPEAWRVRAFSLYVLGRFEEAVAAGTRAIEAWPADTRSWQRRGYARLALGLVKSGRGEDGRSDLQGAEADLTSAIRQQDGLYVAYGFRGIIRYFLADMEKRHGKDPRPGLRESILDCLEAQRRKSEGFGYGKILALARTGLAEAERDFGADARELFALAASEYEQMAKLSPGDASAQYDWGRALSDLAQEQRRHGEDVHGTLEGAARAHASAIALDPENAAYPRARGYVYSTAADEAVRQGLPALEFRSLAVADFTAALKLDPQLVAARVQRGILYMDLARDRSLAPERSGEYYPLSMADFDAALELVPGDGRALLHRGLLHYYLGLRQRKQGVDPSESFGKSLVDLDRAIASGQSLTAGLTNRALLRLAEAEQIVAQKGDPRALLDLVMVDAGKAAELEPTFGKPHSVLGDALMTRGRWEYHQGLDESATLSRSAEAFQAAVQRGDREAYLSMGQVLAMLGRFDESIEAFTRGGELVAAASSWAREQIEYVAQLKREVEERERRRPWKDALALGRKLLGEEKFVPAREQFREGLDVWEAQSAEEKRDQLAIRSVRDTLASSNYYYAGMLSMQALGREDGGATVREVTDEERERLLVLVFRHLHRALDLGWSNLDRLRSEAALLAWHGDPRWQELLRRLEK